MSKIVCPLVALDKIAIEQCKGRHLLSGIVFMLKKRDTSVNIFQVNVIPE